MKEFSKVKPEIVTSEYAQKRAEEFLFHVHSSALDDIVYNKDFVDKVYKLYLDTSLTNEDCYNIFKHWKA